MAALDWRRLIGYNMSLPADVVVLLVRRPGVDPEGAEWVLILAPQPRRLINTEAAPDPGGVSSF